MIIKVSSAMLGAALSFASAGFAHATLARVWVSGAGTDQAGCGPIATPCRTLQYGHDQTNAGGEVNFKDSAGYGPLVINKAINIVADGVFAGVLASSGSDGIAVNAGAGHTVVLRGLSIEGAGVGLRGIYFTSGGALIIANCLVQNFTSDPSSSGIDLSPSTGTPTVAISNTTVANNKFAGIRYSPQGNSGGALEVDHLAANAQQYGIFFNLFQTTGTATAAVSNSVATGNTIAGLSFTGPSTFNGKIDTSTLANNTVGLHVESVVYLGRTTIFGNSTGVENFGAINTYGNNEVDGNGTDVSGNVLVSKALK